MKIDFHSHSKINQPIPFNEHYLQHILTGAKKNGLDAICITEHAATFELEKLFNYVETHLVPQGDSFIAPPTQEAIPRVFMGLEIDCHDGGQFLLVGHLQYIRTIYKEIYPQPLDAQKAKPEHPSFKKIVNLAAAYPVLFGMAHPYRGTGPQGSGTHANAFRTAQFSKAEHMPDRPLADFSSLDFLDLNGKDVVLGGQEMIQRVTALGQQLNCPLLAGSDAHYPLQFGCSYTQFNEEITTISGLKTAIAQNQYCIHHHPFGPQQVEASRAIKKLIKALFQQGISPMDVLYKK